MKLVVDIDDNLYTRLFDNGVDNYDDAVDMAKAIRKGTPLPKGHGDLKDVDELYEKSRLCHTEEDGTACVEWREINDAPTIIEADKEGDTE